MDKVRPEVRIAAVHLWIRSPGGGLPGAARAERPSCLLQKEDTFEDLQRMFAEIVDGDGGAAFGGSALFGGGGGGAAAQGREARAGVRLHEFPSRQRTR